MMKKMRAGVHNDLTRLRIPSMEWNNGMEWNVYISILQKNNNTATATRTSLLRDLRCYATLTELPVQ